MHLIFCIQTMSFIWTLLISTDRCASGYVVQCRICNREVAGSNLGLGYFTPRSTQPSIPPGSVNEYQQQLGRQRQVWLIPIADERVGVHRFHKLWNPSRTRAIPECFCGGDSLRRGAISSVWTPFTSNGEKYSKGTKTANVYKYTSILLETHVDFGERLPKITVHDFCCFRSVTFCI